MLKTERPSLTGREIRHQLLSNSVIQDGISLTTIHRAVRNDMHTEQKWTFKRLKGPPIDRFTDHNMRYTQAYLDYIYQQDPAKMLFFDESGFKHTDANRRYGHSEIGTPCVEINRMKDRANLTLNLLVGIDGVKYFNFVDGPSDMVYFMNFFFEANESVLDDGRPIIPPGSIIVADNAAIHHNQAERVLTRYFNPQGITLIFLPTYSPDFNPCENCFNKIKLVLKQAQYYDLVKDNLKLAVTLAIRKLCPSDLLEFFKGTETLNI